MLGDESISPRAAIRSWLHNAEDRPRQSDKSESLKQPERSGRSRRDSTKPGTGEPRRSRRPATEQYSPRQGRHEFEELGLKHDVAGTGRVPKQQILLGPKGLNLAERLGLHAPFRTFRDHSDDGEVDLDALSRPQKRRRRASSSSSYLEAAERDDAGEHDRGADHYTRIPESRRKARKHTRSSARSSSEALPETLPPPANHTTSYERRSRHKTREDRYDLKKPDDAREKRRSTKKEGAEKRHKPRKRKEKSGAALVHDFAAQNVAQDRLTVSYDPDTSQRRTF